MEKKEIYEHLANIYLDAAQKRKVKLRKPSNKNHLFISLGLTAIAALFILILTVNLLPFGNSAEQGLIIYPRIIKLSNDTNPIKHNKYHIELKRTKPKGVHSLRFSARKINFSDKARLIVEIVNSPKERARVYIDNLSEKWQDYQIALKDFGHITDWSNILRVSFLTKGLKLKTNSYIIYINDVRFVK